MTVMKNTKQKLQEFHQECLDKILSSIITLQWVEPIWRKCPPMWLWKRIPPEKVYNHHQRPQRQYLKVENLL